MSRRRGREGSKGREESPERRPLRTGLDIATRPRASADTHGTFASGGAKERVAGRA